MISCWDHMLPERRDGVPLAHLVRNEWIKHAVCGSLRAEEWDECRGEGQGQRGCLPFVAAAPHALAVPPEASAQGFLWQIFGLCILLLGPFLTCDFLLHFDSQKPFNNSAQACIFVGGAEAEEHSDTNDLMRNIFLGSIMQPPVK